MVCGGDDCPDMHDKAPDGKSNDFAEAVSADGTGRQQVGSAALNGWMSVLSPVKGNLRRLQPDTATAV
nr:hypothetical protein [Escherichia coli]